MSKYSCYILLCLLITFAACTHNTTEESKEPKETEIPLAFSFSSTLPPYKESLAATFLKSFNTASVNSARENHENSTMVMVDEDSMAVNKKVPLYENISFFPILNKDTLESVYYSSLDKKSDLAHTEMIDFNRYFTLVVAHPPSGNLYLDVLSEQHIPVPGDTLRLSLSSDLMPSGNGNPNPGGTFWSTGVYKLQKQKYKVLAVDYQGNTHVFKLK